MRLLLMSLVLLATACSSAGFFYDPVFTSVGTPRASSGECPDGSTCVEVPVTGLASAAGRTGQCEIYTTPGDPATMEPLASEDVKIPATDGTSTSNIMFLWQVAIPADVEPTELNPVCAPMIEG